MNVVAVDYKVYRWGMALDDSMFAVPKTARIAVLPEQPLAKPVLKPASLKK